MPLEVYPRKGSPFWYVRGTVEGTEIYKTTKCREERDAIRFARILEVQIYERHERITSGKKTLSEAIDLYLTNGGEDTYIEKIRKAIGEYYLDEIDQALIDRTAREIYPTQSNASVKRWFYDPIVTVLRYAAKLKYCPLVLIEKPKVKRPPAKWAEPSWFEAFWPSCSPQLRALTTLLLYTGCRISEALNIQWEAVNFKEKTIYIPDTKTDVPRTIYLREIVIERLNEIKPKKPLGKVFPWKTKDGAAQAIRRAIARCNRERRKARKNPIPYLSSHQIGSHTYATWMRRYAGLDQRGLVGTGRWKSIDSTMIYTHTVASEEARKADLLPVPGAKSVQSLKKRRKT